MSTNIFNLLTSIILGLIEGITEFLPISSTGHIILIQNYFLNYKNDLNQILIVTMQFGTTLSTIIILWKQLYNIHINCISHFFIKKEHNCNKHLCLYHIFIGTIPGIVTGTIFYEKIKLLFLDPMYIIHGLIFGNIFLLFGEWNLSKSLSKRVINIDHISYLQAFLIGCCQCLSFCPGFSRSGSTIAGGLLVGLNRRISLEFSFLLSIPIIWGSIILTMYNQKFTINIINLLILIVSSTISFITSFFTIKIFLKIIQNISLIPFIGYRFLLAAIIYWYL